MSKEMKPDDSWKAESDADTLMRAAEIRTDPERLQAALEILSKKKKAIGSIEDLKARAEEMSDEEDEDEEEENDD